jgi:hypothetical protein
MYRPEGADRLLISALPFRTILSDVHEIRKVWLETLLSAPKTLKVVAHDSIASRNERLMRIYPIPASILCSGLTETGQLQSMSPTENQMFGLQPMRAMH